MSRHLGREQDRLSLACRGQGRLLRGEQGLGGGIRLHQRKSKGKAFTQVEEHVKVKRDAENYRDLALSRI